MRRTVSNLARLREIATVVAKHGFGRILDRTQLRERLESARRAEPADEATRSLTQAQRFVAMLQELGVPLAGTVLNRMTHDLPVFLERLL